MLKSVNVWQMISLIYYTPSRYKQGYVVNSDSGILKKQSWAKEWHLFVQPNSLIALPFSRT